MSCSMLSEAGSLTKISHSDAFLLVALASRICESLQLDRAAEELERESWDSASDSAQLSLSRLRAWLQTVVLSSKFVIFHRDMHILFHNVDFPSC